MICGRLLPTTWIPVLVFRASGRPCLCYHPWYDDEGCACVVPT